MTEKSVIRGGYGIVYPTSAAQGMRDAIATNTFNQSVRTNQTSGPALGINPAGGNFGRGLTPFNNAVLASVQGIAANAIPFDLQAPRIEQFNATFEHEFMNDLGVRVSYIGSRAHGLIAGFDLNELAPNNTPFGVTDGEGNPCYDTTPGVITDDLGNCVESAEDEARRPFPDGLGSFLASYGNVGRGHSHAFQVEVNRRFARGLTFNFSYTLLDQKSSGLDIGNSSLVALSTTSSTQTRIFTRLVCFASSLRLVWRVRHSFWERTPVWQFYFQMGGRCRRWLPGDLEHVCQEWYRVYTVLDL
jgi:hypothetical protein